jgi:putative NADPH-quinone reductase
MPQDILVVLSHPDIRHSRVNRALRRAVQTLPRVTVHELYETYPNFHVDVEREQALLARHQLIVLQHPMYWYHAPALCQQWLEAVLTEGFAYGRGPRLAGKSLLCVVSTGTARYEFPTLPARDPSPEGLLLPFQLTALYCGLRYEPPLVYYGGEQDDETALAEHAAAYRRRLAGWGAHG